MQRLRTTLLLLAAASSAFGLASPEVQDTERQVRDTAKAVGGASKKEATPRDTIQLVAGKATPAPGLILIDGGQTWIGSSTKEIEELLKKYPKFVRVLDAQTPQQRVNVQGFWIGTYELTNVEYKAFVDATGYKPPIYWAPDGAMNDAMRAFAKEEQDKFDVAAVDNRRYEKRKWADGAPPNPRSEWWDAHWREGGYAIPKDQERYPIVYVTHMDAEAYCEWAGLRLPTEFEFQRASRKDSKSAFPWGDEWEDGKYANTEELRRAKPLTVGSFTVGASPFGIHDLSGNVWEWTASPYDPYDGYKANEYTVEEFGRKEKRKAEHQWDANQRVVVGGSFQEPQLGARVATRRGADRSQFTDALGFRVASSERVGLDKAQWLLANGIRNAKGRPDGVRYTLDGVVALDRWNVGAPGITGYDYIVFVPVEEMTQTTDSELRRASTEAPVHLGILASNIAMVDPELTPDVYFVAFRAKGKPPRVTKDEAAAEGEDKGKKGKDDAAAAQEPAELIDPVLEGLDLDKDWLLFIRASDGTRAAAVEPKEPLKWDKGTGGGTFKVRQASERVGSGAAATIEQRTYLDLEAGLTGKLRGRAVQFPLPLRPDVKAFGAPWRQ